MLTRVLACLVLLAPAVGGTAVAQGVPRPAQNTELPVRSVMLFSSGVGYFEHAGSVSGAAATELRFRSAQINDVLKSLVLLDLDGGRVTNVAYPANDPIARTLRAFQVDIASNPTLAQLLSQLRGTAVTVQAQGERVAGTILGVETPRRAVGGSQPVDAPVLTVLSGASIRAIAFETIASLTLDDPQLQQELTRALAAVSEARSQDRKPVTIGFAGTGARRVRVGYVVETPVWKTTYRLLLDSTSDRLHGWAVVENQTESDWTGVSLSLVSGRPISFTMDLYTPLYASRPRVVPEMYAALRPQVYGAGMGAVEIKAPPVPLVEHGVAGAVSSITSEMMATRRSGAADVIQAASSTERFGALFHYKIDDVTIQRQRSAMLPIINDSITAERVSIYNTSVLASHPLVGVRLRNTTGKHLLQGPVTVLDRGSYAGDARLDDVPPGQDRLLSYGVDLEVVVQRRTTDRTPELVTGRITKGVLQIDHRHIATAEYVLSHKSDREKVIIVEHPIRAGWTLVDTPRPVESTQSTHRFQGRTRPGVPTTLTVTEQRVNTQELALVTAEAVWLTAQSRRGELPQRVRDALSRAAGLQQAVADAERDVAARNAEIVGIGEEQVRIRENMKTVGQATQYYERLLAKLNEQESRIEQLERERAAAMERRDARRAEFQAFVAELDVR